jgi:hypothetical protein
MHGNGLSLRVSDFEALSLVGGDRRSIGVNVEPVREDTR